MVMFFWPRALPTQFRQQQRLCAPCCVCAPCAANNTEPPICSGVPGRLTVPGKGNPSTKLKLAQPFLHVQAFRGAPLSFARNQSAVETQSAVALPPGELCNGNPICSGNPIYSGNPLSSGDPNCSGDANCMCRTVACSLTARAGPARQEGSLADRAGRLF